MGVRRKTRSPRQRTHPPAYSAFISYSHAGDGTLAVALQQALHAFAKPWYRLRALRVFRDEASLSANPQLWMSIQSALERSEFFILLASPTAAQSRWVQRETAYRAQSLGAANLLVVLTEGEIAWDEATGDFDWARTTALPSSLAGAFTEEPRFIDFRWASHVDQLTMRNPAFRYGVAEIAAPLHHRDKDELAGEDLRQHRRTLRLARTAVIALVLLTLAAGSGALIAVNQRNSARNQAMVATSRQLAATAITQEGTRLDRALLLSLEAIRFKDTPEARGALLRSLQASDGLIRSTQVDGSPLAVAWSPDGRIMATGGPGTVVQLWDGESGELIGEFIGGHTAPVESVAFSPHGERLASSSADGTIVLWDVTTKRRLGAPLVGHDQGVQRVAFSPNGEVLASAGDDRKVVLWDVATSAPRGPPLSGHDAAVRSVAFSEDGAYLVSAGFDASVAVWDVGQARRIAILRHEQPLSALAFAPRSTVLVSGSTDGVVKIWDVAAGRELGEPLNVENGATSVAISNDGRTLVVGTYDGRLSLWDLDRRRRISELIGGHGARVNEIAFRPKSSTELVSVAEDGTIAQWRTDRRSRVGTPLEGDQAWVKGVAFGPSGGVLAAGMGNGAVVLWDIPQRRPIAVLHGHEGVVNDVAFSPEGTRVASVGMDGSVRLWDVQEGRPLGEPLRGHDGPVNSVAFSTDGLLLASAGIDHKVVLWDSRDGSPLRTLLGHTGEVTSVAFGGDSVLASAAADHTVVVWNAQSGRPIGEPLRGHGESSVNGVAFSPNGRVLATAGSDRNIVLWDVETARTARTLPGHLAEVNSVAFSADGRLLASGGVDHTVVLWDIASGRVLGQPLAHSYPVESVAFDPSGRYLASGSVDYTVVLWDVSVASWQRQACAVVGRNLTEEEWDQFVGSDRKYHRTCGDAARA